MSRLEVTFMKPIIGIVPSIEEKENKYFIHEDNINAIKNAGGNPILLPYNLDENDLNQFLQFVDGLYLTGGFDIDPTFFGEEPHPRLGMINRQRDEVEIMLIHKFCSENKPILAICRGCQIVNIAMNGDMYQDIYSQLNIPLLQHEQKAIKSHASHFVKVLEGSLLYQLVKKQKIKVNSRHLQANRKLGNTLITSGNSSDGIIEAIESKKYRFLLGLQWHPENMAVAGDETSIKIYQGFINACLGKEREGI